MRGYFFNIALAATTVFATSISFADTNISIDKDNQFCMIVLNSTKLSPDSGPKTLFDGINVSGDNLGSSGAEKSFETSDKDLQVSCSSIPMANFSNCQVLMKRGPNATFDVYDKEVKYAVKGDGAAFLFAFFKPAADGAFRMQSDDKLFGIFASKDLFVLKGHPKPPPVDKP